MSNRPVSATAQLASILAEPVVSLPSGRADLVATELREMSSPAARAVWADDRWIALVSWILRRAPECDPVLPAVHALRRAPAISQEPAMVNLVARYVLAAARRSVVDRPDIRSTPLNPDLPAVSAAPQSASVSLATEAAELLRVNGVVASGAVQEMISEHVDIAVDWLDGFASHTGRRGEALVIAARDSAAMTSESRLRHHIDGPASRPLVALLLGGDQWGRQARHDSGNEASLVLWALALRRARLCGEPEPVPPAPVVRAWTTAAHLIAQAIAPADTAAGPELTPSVAA